jgi:hypothetical protein
MKKEQILAKTALQTPMSIDWARELRSYSHVRVADYERRIGKQEAKLRPSGRRAQMRRGNGNILRLIAVIYNLQNIFITFLLKNSFFLY